MAAKTTKTNGPRAPKQASAASPSPRATPSGRAGSPAPGGKPGSPRPQRRSARPPSTLAPGERPHATRHSPRGPRLSPGSAAPAFALRDQTSRIVRSGDFAGRKLLVYFYPKSDTPGCTVQSCSVRDHRKDLQVLGVDVVGISPDSPKAQARFDEKYGLGFPLLADENHVVAEAYGAWGEKLLHGRTYMGIIRSSFLIDEKGRIVEAWYGVKPEQTVLEARRML